MESSKELLSLLKEIPNKSKLPSNDLYKKLIEKVFEMEEVTHDVKKQNIFRRAYGKYLISDWITTLNLYAYIEK